MVLRLRVNVKQIHEHLIFTPLAIFDVFADFAHLFFASSSQSSFLHSLFSSHVLMHVLSSPNIPLPSFYRHACETNLMHGIPYPFTGLTGSDQLLKKKKKGWRAPTNAHLALTNHFLFRSSHLPCWSLEKQNFVQKNIFYRAAVLQRSPCMPRTSDSIATD